MRFCCLANIIVRAAVETRLPWSLPDSPRNRAAESSGNSEWPLFFPPLLLFSPDGHSSSEPDFYAANVKATIVVETVAATEEKMLGEQGE